MRLSTSTNMIYSNQRWLHTADILRVLSSAGYQVLDWNARGYVVASDGPGSNPFTALRWRKWMEEWCVQAEQRGVVFNQAHGLMYDYFAPDERTQWMHQMTERVMQGCAMLGINTIVYHPYEPEGTRERQDVDACRSANIAYMRRAGEMAARYGLKIAVENMISNHYLDGGFFWRYCTHIDELIDLVDTIDMENVQCCLDTGHAHYSGEDLYDAILKLGARLIALHVHDNNRYDDLHLLPYHGTINWDRVLKGLRAVNYQGDFTYEIPYVAVRAPEALYPLYARTSYEVGQYLLKQYEKLL